MNLFSHRIRTFNRASQAPCSQAPRFPLARTAALVGVMLVAAALVGVPAARAESIGISFTGVNAANALAAGTSAGVVAQTNWNNLSQISETGVALKDNLGAATITTLTYAATSGGTTINAASNSNFGGDEQFNNGSIRSPQDTPINLTLNNISYGTYDLYVYNLDFAGAVQQTTLGAGATATSFYSTSPDPRSAGAIDLNAATPFVYTQATSTDAANPTLNANYVRFSDLRGANQSFSVTGLTNLGRVVGVQVVATPEPSTYAMMALGAGAIGLMTWKRKRGDTQSDTQSDTQGDTQGDTFASRDLAGAAI